MFRTQIYLPKSLYQSIDLLAKQEKKSKAQIIREVIAVGIKEKQPQETLGEALDKLIALGGGMNMKGPTDLSSNHDKYLYD